MGWTTGGVTYFSLVAPYMRSGAMWGRKRPAVVLQGIARQVVRMRKGLRLCAFIHSPHDSKCG